MTFVVAGAVLTGVFVAGARAGLSDKTTGVEPAPGTGDISSFFQFTPRNPGELQVALPDHVIASSEPVLPKPADEHNLTDQLAYLFTTGLSQGSSADQAMADAQRGVSGLITYQLFDEGDIVTTDDNSLTAQKRYLETYQRILNRRLAGININMLERKLSATNSDTEVVQALLAPIPGILSDLLATPVPSAWTQVHLMLLNLWQRQKDAYEALAHYEEDSLRAMLALQELPTLIRTDQSIREEFTRYYTALSS